MSKEGEPPTDQPDPSAVHETPAPDLPGLRHQGMRVSAAALVAAIGWAWGFGMFTLPLPNSAATWILFGITAAAACFASGYAAARGFDLIQAYLGLREDHRAAVRWWVLPPGILGVLTLAPPLVIGVLFCSGLQLQ